MKVLVTGFDPFGGEKVNPALEAVKMLPNSLTGIEIFKRELPTVFHLSIDTLKKHITEVNPDAVICVGQAGGRYAICPERVAINIDDARIGDNCGNQPIDKTIIEGGETAYFSTLPIKIMVENMKTEGIPAQISNSAGTFVCNHIMYALLHLTKTEFKNIKQAGFIHVPYIPNQVLDKKDTASMDINMIARGLEIAVISLI